MSETHLQLARLCINFMCPNRQQLKGEDYDRALSILTSDIRYQLHLLLYRRIQWAWLLVTTILCISFAITSLELGLCLGASLVWLALQLVGAIVTDKSKEKVGNYWTHVNDGSLEPRWLLA